jgi:hypothetical protein
VNISRQLEADHVRVALEWTHKNGVSYSISVDPEVNVGYTRRESAQLVVPYNSEYNISVIASLCGRSRTVFTIINYGKLLVTLIYHYYNYFCSEVPSSNY